MWLETMESSVATAVADRTEVLNTLREELARLGCGCRNCGFLGLIFVPRSTGGFNFDKGILHYWDLGINVYLDWEHAMGVLSELPANAGQECVSRTLLEMAH